MSNYVYGSGISYLQYLQAKSFVGDISSASRKAGREISMQVSRQTREIIASNEALARENIRVSQKQHYERLDAIYDATDSITGAIDAASDRITGALSEGFDRVTYQLQDISSSISELNATFHWGFSQMIAGIGHMNDSLSELIKIAKTPVQTVAFNHFEIARDAFRQGLYQESLEELQKSIQGDHTSPGYKLEWRFHQMLGTIRLGFVDCDLSLVDLAQAEEAFLSAARYARADYSEDAAHAFLSAGWAVYCQGKMKEALSHTEQAIALAPKLTEALFQAAKVRMALGEVDSALPILRQAIDRDRFYILKAAGDGDFQKYDEKVRDFIEAMRLEKYRSITEKVQRVLKDADPWLSRDLPQDMAIQSVVILKKFLKNKPMPFWNLIEASADLLNAVIDIEHLTLKWKQSEEVKIRVRAILKQAEPWLSRKLPEDEALECVVKLREFMNNNYMALLDLIDASVDLQETLNKMNDLTEKWNESEEIKRRAKETLKEIDFWRNHSPDAKKDADLKRIEMFLNEDRNLPLLDIIEKMDGLGKAISEVRFKVKNISIILTTKIEDFSYEEIIKPASLFRKAETVKKNLNVIRDDIYLDSGELITSIEFCQLPAGNFIMDEKGTQREVTIRYDFYLVKFPITQGQWYSVMGNNTSRFKSDLNLSVKNVSLYDCQLFINKLNDGVGKMLYRLPTEDEWKYACRLGSLTDYYFCNNIWRLDHYISPGKNNIVKTLILLKKMKWFH